MIKALVTMLLAGAFALPTIAHPFKVLYGDEIRFQVLRDRQPVGHYTTRFHTTGEGWQARVEMTLSLSVLLLWQYDYHYRALERWQGDRLSELEIRINDNGERQTLRLTRSGDQLVPAPGSTSTPAVDLPILTTHHFDPAVVTSRRVLNTLTGRENRVQVVHLGEERLKVGDKQIASDRYRYQGDLHDTEVWYAKTGQWLKLRFADKSGTPIEFHCLQCGI